MYRKSFLPILCLLLAASGLWAANAPRPAGFPSRPVEIIVPFAAGGGMDTSMRTLAKYAEPDLGQQITVANMTAGGNIQGNLAGINAAPDGHVWCAWANGLVTDEMIIRNVSYTYRDVLPVAMVAREPHVIAVGAAFAARNNIGTLDDLFAFARANPGRVIFGAGGNWTTHDFVRVKMEEAAGVKFVRMPFLGGAPAAAAAAEGNCDVVSPILSEFMRYLDDDRLIPLAIASEERAPRAPGIPTAIELGYDGLTQSIWRVVALPKDTPMPVARFIESVIRRTLDNPDFLAEAADKGMSPLFVGMDGLAEFLRAEHEYFYEKTGEWGVRIDSKAR